MKYPTYLSCNKEVGKHEHRHPGADEVSHRLHDIPGVLPPGETGKEPKLS